jgi:hypothetical protein
MKEKVFLRKMPARYSSVYQRPLGIEYLFATAWAVALFIPA